MTGPTDEALMAKVSGGDVRTLAILFERHHKSLYNYFRHMNGDADLSQDLVQEVFFRILRYRRTYDSSRAFSPWIYQIARNTSAEHAQKRKTELRLVPQSNSDEDAPEPVSTKPGADETLRQRQEVRLLHLALDRLPPEKREVLVLSRFQDMSYETIANVLGCETGAVKVRVYRAIRALSQIYFELVGEKAS